MFDDKTILLTGGTGSFGHKCVEILLKRWKPKRLIIFSRDEMKHWEMQQAFPQSLYPTLRFFIGDVRDRERLYRAMREVNYVIHAAALKIVPTAEYNPFEAIRTNIHGTENVISACLDRGVEKAIILSTDKAVSPANLYGATKLCAEKMFVAGNAYAGESCTTFGVVRYGNVIGSRGSVVPLFMRQRESGEITVTDASMTRFWITLTQGVDFVLSSLEMMEGGEIFVPKLPTMNLMDLARIIAQDCRIKIVGLRPGEKIHESMLSVEESRNALEYDDRYIILPHFHFQTRKKSIDGKPVQVGFEYTSGNNHRLLTEEQLLSMLSELYPCFQNKEVAWPTIQA